jgi:hypothetical protein
MFGIQAWYQNFLNYAQFPVDGIKTSYFGTCRWYQNFLSNLNVVSKLPILAPVDGIKTSYHSQSY